jgi:hypothetical protein
MAISFPNRSRSYDATRRAVRFWGHDRSKPFQQQELERTLAAALERARARQSAS